MAGLLYTRCLMLNNNYTAAEKILDHINILPYEGADGAHKLYVRTKLNLALQSLKNRNYKLASKKVSDARQWPERLGAGAPYPDMVDNTLQDQIQKLINETQKGQKLQEGAVDDILKKINFTGRNESN